MRRGEQTLYCDLEPSTELMAFFNERNDGQIMSLELLSIALGTPPPAFLHDPGVSYTFCAGLSTFADQIRGRKLVIWSDNKGAELSTKKGQQRVHAVRTGISVGVGLQGSARSFDHCCLLHCMWRHLLALHVDAWIMRVPTKENLSDLPSR